jgi:hypothetical protein
MPADPDLNDDERAELVAVLREVIERNRYFMSPRVRRLKSILAKIDPASVKHVGTPYPAPKPRGKPSLLYRKLKGGRRHFEGRRIIGAQRHLRRHELAVVRTTRKV